MPKRPKAHETNIRGLALVTQIMADDWIIRKQTEEDYGIDLEIEFVDKGHVSGAIAKIQLKSTETDPFTRDSVISKYVSLSTARYYLRLDLPVYFFLADITNNSVYWTNAQRSLRRNWNPAKKMRIVRLQRISTLSRPESKFFLMADALTWRSWQRVYETARFYIDDFKHYAELAHRCDYADSFMLLEPDELQQLRRFDSQTRRLARAFAPFEIDTNSIPTLTDLERETTTKWKMRFSDIPYGVAKKATEPLTMVGLDLCKRIQSKVVDEETVFWMDWDLDTYTYLSNLNFPDAKKFIDVLKWALRY